MNDTSEDAKVRRGRSPAYPNIGLVAATQKARLFYVKARKHSVPVSTACGFLGLAPGGNAYRYIAALISFGLLDEEGSKENREVRLSGIGLAITQLPEGDSERELALQEAVTRPRIYKEILEKWSDDLPPDEVIARYLIRERGYNDEIVSDLVRDFRESFEYAGLSGARALASEPTIPENMADIRNGKSDSYQQSDRDTAIMPATSQGQVSQDQITLPILIARGRIATLYMPSDISRKEYERIRQYLDFFADTLFEDRDEVLSENISSD